MTHHDLFHRVSVLNARLLLVWGLTFGLGGCMFAPSGAQIEVDGATNQNNANQNHNQNTNTNHNENNNNNNDVAPNCGDGQLQAAESCDDGNTTNGDGCDDTCTVEGGWSCNGAPSVCFSVCGDGLIVGDEECDDGNLNPEDGCSNFCQIEVGWNCAQEPSTCTPVCGDGWVRGEEACDDGNTENADGCSASCTVEDFHACSDEPSVCTCVYYVDLDISAGDGSRWSEALGSVGAAVAALDSATGTGICEIWVAEGVYHIYETDVDDTLTLISGVEIYGGFAGVEAANGGETSRSERLPRDYHTVLDGASSAVPSVHVEHVVSANGVVDTVLDGFVIRNGGPQSGDIDGGGLAAYDSDLTVGRCVFTNHLNANDGGAIYAENSNIQLLDSRIRDNVSTDDGGGVTFRTNSEALIERCTFVNNTGGDRGGGLCAHGSNVTVRDSLFRGNVSPRGGAISLRDATLEFYNCTFFDNTSSSEQGGALFGDNSTLSGANSIFYANTPTALSHSGGDPIAVSYSFVPIGTTGTGNISGDPGFVDTGDLSSPDLHLSADSPCIDAANGDLASDRDLAHNPRFDAPSITNSGAGTPPYVDMGAFEYQAP
jgi:cysteine-rich repeat protein